MKASDFEKWIFDALLQILHALAENEFLKETLIFKGAIILNQYLSNSRKSLDIDSNLSVHFVESNPDREQQKEILKSHLEKAITRHFERRDPVRYELSNIKIESNPKHDHPRGWDGFRIIVSITDHENSGVRGLPTLTIDVAAPEPLSDASLKKMRIGRSTILAYSLERIAGEKARAYLSSLRTYRNKVSAREKTARVRDLYDLANILRHHGISDTAFWDMAGREFKLACEPRFVDCPGTDCFFEDWPIIEGLYLKSSTIPQDISIDEIKESVLTISIYWKKINIIPFSFPAPATMLS